MRLDPSTNKRRFTVFADFGDFGQELSVFANNLRRAIVVLRKRYNGAGGVEFTVRRRGVALAYLRANGNYRWTAEYVCQRHANWTAWDERYLTDDGKLADRPQVFSD